MNRELPEFSEKRAKLLKRMQRIQKQVYAEFEKAARCKVIFEYGTMEFTGQLIGYNGGIPEDGLHIRLTNIRNLQKVKR